MATPDCDNSVTVDLENNGGGGCGGHDGPVPGVQKPGSPTYDPDFTIVSYLLLYYFFFMFYLIGFSKSWWLAALGIVMPLAFLVLTIFLDFATPQELKQLKLTDNSRQLIRVIVLVLYYFFFMFYVASSSEYWGHAALGIVLVTGFVLLSILLPVPGNDKYKKIITPGREHNDVKPPDGDSNDLSTSLLGCRN